jgi:hypothetical protein
MGHEEIDQKAPAAAKPRSPRSSEVATRPEDQAVAKANEAIAIRPKRGKLTLLSRRIYNVFLYHAQQQGVENPSYSILLSELIDDARFTSNNTELLKSHIRDMQATTIEWHTSGGQARQWTSTQLLGPVVIDEPGRGQACTITWTYPQPIRERLVKPAQYTRVLLEISSQMRSYAASVLYELGARYLTSPGRLTMREDVIWWASVLTGRSDITTVDYRILHRDTIKKALAELDTLCEDFKLEIVEHKRGRKVEELQFRVLPKPQVSLAGLRDSAVDQATHNKIVSFIWGIADDVLRDLFKRGKYPDVILPMCVLRRMDAVLEPTKQAVLDTKQMLDERASPSSAPRWPMPPARRSTTPRASRCAT